ncbi:MAG: TatD family hydrolase [Pasteurella oralis]|uniref:TatD family hydrolase n=1 Tax=Pasteurella oralis TaxID=1071947 RepID=UPI00270B5069|nr:TatD family hydrolase [Pasteurella oralis]
MAFFDTHTHLDYLQRDTGESVEQLLNKALQVRVNKILIVSVLAKDFEIIEKMTALYPQYLYYGLGLHPLYIQQHTHNDLELLDKKLLERSSNCTAVAEIGLERSMPELLADQLWYKQCEFLEAQLYLARQYQLPVNLHSRKAHDQLFMFLKRIPLARGGVVHGFSGSYEQAKRFIELGYKIGVGGTITYQRAKKTRETISRLPLDCLLLETDTPDMPVFGFQGQPNRPERVFNIFQALCELRAEAPEQIEQIIWQQSVNLFANKNG